jgi:hypothetical protein
MRSGHAVGPILRTAAQNDQIRAALLKITSQPSATPNGGSARGYQELFASLAA